MSKDNVQITMSGAWCAPSEHVYDLGSLQPQPLLMLPDISTAQGVPDRFAPETDEQKVRRIEHERRHAEWENSRPGVDSDTQVWLAYRDDSYDGEHLLGVAASEELARRICQHAADEPNRWRDKGDTTIDWENGGLGGNRWYGVRQIGVRE